jgi:hypothetical protein
MMSDASQKRRARLMAILLGVVAVLLYFGFMWMTASGKL